MQRNDSPVPVAKAHTNTRQTAHLVIFTKKHYRICLFEDKIAFLRNAFASLRGAPSWSAHVTEISQFFRCLEMNYWDSTVAIPQKPLVS
jgi:hypothetical protein